MTWSLTADACSDFLNPGLLTVTVSDADKRAVRWRLRTGQSRARKPGLGADGSVDRSGNHADAEALADLVPLVAGGRAVDLAEVVRPRICM